MVWPIWNFEEIFWSYVSEKCIKIRNICVWVEKYKINIKIYKYDLIHLAYSTNSTHNMACMICTIKHNKLMSSFSPTIIKFNNHKV